MTIDRYDSGGPIIHISTGRSMNKTADEILDSLDAKAAELEKIAQRVDRISEDIRDLVQYLTDAGIRTLELREDDT